MALKIAWTCAALLVVIPAGLLIYKPDLFTPLTAFLVSMAQFFLALQIGSLQSADSARKSANAKWLPPAESACDRLLTVSASVASLAKDSRSLCKKAGTDLPEFKEPKNKAIRILIERHCCEIGNRLRDIQNHLEGAFADWQRFIRQNCEGSECQRIFNESVRRRAALAAAESSQCIASAIEEASDQRGGYASAYALSVARSSENKDGSYSIIRESPTSSRWSGDGFVLTQEEAGWRITDDKGETYFWKDKVANDGPEGSYWPCPTCNHDGFAMVN